MSDKSIERLAEAYQVSITLKKTAKQYQWEIKIRDNDPTQATHRLRNINDEMIERYGSAEDEIFHSTYDRKTGKIKK